MSRTENPDEIVLENVKMFHLESMNERALWIGVYTKDNKIYHLNIVAKNNELNYFWSDETPDEVAQGHTNPPVEVLEFNGICRDNCQGTKISSLPGLPEYTPDELAQDPTNPPVDAL